MRLKVNRQINLKLLTLLIIAPYFALSTPGVNNKTSANNYYPFVNSLIIPLSEYSSDDYTWTSAEDSIAIPLRRAGRIFLIDAEIDGEKGYLVFDTGAKGIVLNKTYFRNHVVIDNQNSNGVTGSVGGVERVNVDNLSIFGLQYKRIIADVANLGHIENKRGAKILGLIGFGMIKNFEIIFNPEQNQLLLFRIDKNGERVKPSSEKFIADYTCKFEFKNNILFLKTAINGKNLRFCFDTGAETNVIDRYAPKSVLNSITISRRSTLTGAGSSTSEVLFGTMNGFPFGGKDLNDMETIITNLDPLSEAYDTKIDGMLGYSFLSKGIICINFVKKEFAISYLKATEE